MFKKQHLALAIAATLAAGAAQAALETSVTLKNETAYMMKDGIRTGEATSTTDTTGEGKGVYKFENTAKIYLNDEMDNGMSWHGELNIVRDTKAIDDYKGHETNTQRDFLRELYIDTTVGDWDLRIGKQQVVWGTADGIKLLDLINPTDFSELNQNVMADARIPVWMINAEKYLDNGANIQAIVSQAKTNNIPGLDPNGDYNHPFVMKGVDTITGQVNGFYNVAPALSRVAGAFNTAAISGMFDTDADGAGNQLTQGLTVFASLTVDSFAGSSLEVNDGGTPGATPALTADDTVRANFAGGDYQAPGYTMMNNIAQNGTAQNTSNGNQNITNLVSGTGWDIQNPDNAFEYMALATFSTFNTFTTCVDGDSDGCDNANGGDIFTGTDQVTGFNTEWVKDNASNTSPNIGFRFKNSTANGVNYSVNFANHYSANPEIKLSWHDAITNEELTVLRAADGNGDNVADANSNLSVDQLTGVNNQVSVLLQNSAGDYYGIINPTTGVLNTNQNGAKLRFTEKMYRVNSIGGSMDMAIETESNPVVLRAEALYTKGEKQPIIDRKLLAIGDLSNALTMEEQDIFKYVIGADTTVMTDMMISGQFIQFRNLDYVDQKATCSNTTPTGVTTTFACDRYNADFATMSLTNGFNKAEENKEFYSLFFSKPFGDSGEGRWNNIFIYEEGGGKWNRFDVEYGFDDQLIGTFEVNKYFGDENTTFGQFENASNVQIGVKYLLQ